MGANYYWIYIDMPEQGTFRLSGPYVSEYQALMEADKLDRDYDIVSIPTSNMSRAINVMKDRRMKEKGEVAVADKRARRGMGKEDAEI